jgi:hypothetical protein
VMPKRGRLNETPPREWPSRTRLSETSRWTASHPIWPAAGHHGEPGPHLVRQDNSIRVPAVPSSPVSVKLTPISLKLAENGRLSH